MRAEFDRYLFNPGTWWLGRAHCIDINRLLQTMTDEARPRHHRLPASRPAAHPPRSNRTVSGSGVPSKNFSRICSKTDPHSDTLANSVAPDRNRSAGDTPPSSVRESRAQRPSLARADGHLQGHGTPNTGPTHSQGGIKTTPLQFPHSLLVPTVLTGVEHGRLQCGQAKWTERSPSSNSWKSCR